MKILLTNDDGIAAAGIHALIDELKLIADLYVASPDRERSATGHSITVYEPIKAVQKNIADVKAAWIIGGTPVDCVKLALSKLIPGDVDLVISGINHGPNLGTDVLYSGTVSAAAEGVIMGKPSIAVSLDSFADEMDFTFAAKFTKRLVLTLMRKGFEPHMLLNVNVPELPEDSIKGIRITQLGLRNYENLFDEMKDPRGNTYYWMGGGIKEEEQDPESDVEAAKQGFISVTPINLDLTDYQLIKKYKKKFSEYIDLSIGDEDDLS
ncbi:MAG TPA: 5'/3'-nucleotidase SurE [Syntrophomonadaceae bacterium]|nr:5'/3'-nucleotidase SurE [Syntrophomonadaceae bacterium]HRX21772.1 5'/3'-nucleotidase SurE [Syntrophomonadaceae bacterium]